MSDQNSSAGEAQQSADIATFDIQPCPSGQQERVSFHASSLADEERDTSGTGIGVRTPSETSRRAGHNTGTGESDSTEQTQQEPTIYGVLLHALSIIDILKSYYLLYAFLWEIPWRVNFICRRFGTLCLFHPYRCL
jgi:hypothetical protein